MKTREKVIKDLAEEVEQEMALFPEECHAIATVAVNKFWPMVKAAGVIKSKLPENCDTGVFPMALPYRRLSTALFNLNWNRKA